MNNRRAFEALSFAVTLTCFVWAALAYATLPETVSTHFNITGAADARGPKWIVWAGALFDGFMFLFLGAMQLVPPRSTNFPVAVTESNRERLYSIQREMLGAMKLAAMLTGLALEWGIVASAQRSELDPLFLPLMLVALGANVVVSLYYILEMFKAAPRA